MSALPLPPRKDPWYTPTDGFALKPPGTVLRVRKAPGRLLEKFTRCADIYNILFRSTSSRHQPSWGVTTLFVPPVSDYAALLSHQIPYNSPDVDSSPSHLLHSVTDTFWESIIEVVGMGMSRGWFVQIPDHEGPHAAHGNGIVAGHTTLDAIRASLATGLGMDIATTKVLLWGFSGGALAAGWAAQLQPQYAPEIPCAAVALGGIAPDMRDVAQLSGTIYAGLIPSLLLGVVAEYPDARDYLISQLKPERKDAFLATYHYDIVRAFQTFPNQDMLDYFIDGADIFRHPLISGLLIRNGTMGHHGVPTMPVFVYKAIHDEIGPIAHADSLVQKWAYGGANILYERNNLGNHVGEATNGKPRALQFLVDHLQGKNIQHGCTIRDVSVELPA